MYVLYHNNVDDYPTIDKIEGDVKTWLTGYFSSYYDEDIVKEAVEELLNGNEYYVNDSSNNHYELRKL